MSYALATAPFAPGSAQLIAFESYRDLVRLQQLNLTEAQGLAFVEQENVALRAQVKSRAAAAAAALQEGDASGKGGACRSVTVLLRVHNLRHNLDHAISTPPEQRVWWVKAVRD